MKFGEIADETGAIWVRWWSKVADRVVPPDSFAKADHGHVWLTPEQADAAYQFGWRRIEAREDLVMVYRQKGNGDAKLS